MASALIFYLYAPCNPPGSCLRRLLMAPPPDGMWVRASPSGRFEGYVLVRGNLGRSVRVSPSKEHSPSDLPTVAVCRHEGRRQAQRQLARWRITIKRASPL